MSGCWRENTPAVACCQYAGIKKATDLLHNRPAARRRKHQTITGTAVNAERNRKCWSFLQADSQRDSARHFLQAFAGTFALKIPHTFFNQAFLAAFCFSPGFWRFVWLDFGFEKWSQKK
jgi:hypothetical protein